MRKVLMGILMSICVITIILPFLSNKAVGISIDGNFLEWSNMPKTSYDKEDKSKANIKTVKYYLDDEYLYLYIERYYRDKEWDITVNVINKKKSDNIQYDVKETFRLIENYETNEIQVFNSADDLLYKEDNSLFNVTKLETKIPLELINKNNDIIYLDIFLVQNEQINLINNKKEYLAITTGSTFGGMKNIVAISAIIYILKKIYFKS